jgi:hypothetical protein
MSVHYDEPALMRPAERFHGVTGDKPGTRTVISKGDDMYESAACASPSKLGHHISWTYFRLRIVMFLLAIFFPISLWGWSYLFLDSLQPGPSISGYYHASTEWIRDHFVGTLSAVGVCLLAYRGFTTWENRLLNVAGLAIIGVAMFPTTPDQAPQNHLAHRGDDAASFGAVPPAGDTPAESSRLSVHGVCAVTFFVCLAVVALTQATHSLRLIDDPHVRRRFAGSYRVIGGLMVILPTIAWIGLQFTSQHWGIFAVESCGVAAFGAYWIVKTLEFRGTHGEPEAILLGTDSSETPSGRSDSSSGPSSPGG